MVISAGKDLIGPGEDKPELPPRSTQRYPHPTTESNVHHHTSSGAVRLQVKQSNVAVPQHTVWVSDLLTGTLKFVCLSGRHGRTVYTITKREVTAVF